MSLARPVCALAAVAAIAFALWQLHAAAAGVKTQSLRFGDTPARVYRPAPPGDAASDPATTAPAAPPSPVVVIAHGFAGSQRLMQGYATAIARAGYVAVTFDFLGHGRHPEPLTGSITEATGATQRLVAQLGDVVTAARPLGDGRLAVLGHSMATDVLVRFASATPGVDASIAVSMFSPAVTATAPRNLLVITGEWEPMLEREALRAVGLGAPGGDAELATTYGDFAAGTARRAVSAPHTEHVSVLYSTAAMREAVEWLDRSFGRPTAGGPAARPAVASIPIATQGPWILLLLGGVTLFAWVVAPLLPRVAALPTGGGRPWRRLALPLLLPMVATPLLLRVLPTHFLPVLVGDYLAVHFLAYGALTALCLRLTRRDDATASPQPGASATAAAGADSGTDTGAGAGIPPSAGRYLAATLAVLAFGFVGYSLPLDRYFTSFVPGAGRRLLVAALLVGTLAYFLADEWLTRGPRAGRAAYLASKFAFVASLALAVALDFERLFFLIIIVPVIALYFVVYGLLSRWTYEATGHPQVAGVANAAAFAWAIACVFPLVAA
jgi:alpha-beta hydrolase superfamily lysophospholipase